MESAYLNIHGILTELDIFFIGTSNEIHLAAFKQHPDFNSFKGRFRIIRAPYLLCYQDETQIYLEQVSGLKEGKQFEPLALESLCLFSVLTRLRSPMSKNYADKKKYCEKLTPLEKALPFQVNQFIRKTNNRRNQILSQHRDEIIDEFINENLYETNSDSRDVKSLIYDLSNIHNDRPLFSMSLTI